MKDLLILISRLNQSFIYDFSKQWADQILLNDPPCLWYQRFLLFLCFKVDFVKDLTIRFLCVFVMFSVSNLLHFPLLVSYKFRIISANMSTLLDFFIIVTSFLIDLGICFIKCFKFDAFDLTVKDVFKFYQIIMLWWVTPLSKEYKTWKNNTVYSMLLWHWYCYWNYCWALYLLAYSKLPYMEFNHMFFINHTLSTGKLYVTRSSTEMNVMESTSIWNILSRTSKSNALKNKMCQI